MENQEIGILENSTHDPESDGSTSLSANQTLELENSSINQPNQEIRALQLQITDLTMRLQNANNTIDVLRQSAINSSRQVELYRRRLIELTNSLRVESSKNIARDRKLLQQQESINYESNKKKAAKLHDELRVTLLDMKMKGIRESRKVQTLKSTLTTLESTQASQKKLLQHIVEFEKVTEALSAASHRGDLSVCQSLIRKGASVNEVDSAGFLPLHYAVAGGHEEVVRLMLEFGTEPSSRLAGHDPVEIAAKHGYGKIIKVLADFGAHVTDRGGSGRPPIVSAALNGHLDCVSDLLTMGADINAFDNDENTPLHVAAQLVDPGSMIRLLLKNGADPSQVNRARHDPLKHALACKNIKAVEALGWAKGMIDPSIVSSTTDDQSIDSLSVTGDPHPPPSNPLSPQPLPAQDEMSSVDLRPGRPRKLSNR